MSFLKENLRRQRGQYFQRVPDEEYIESAARAWMNDATNSRHRFHTIEQVLPQAKKILDMASGCGTFVFYGDRRNGDWDLYLRSF